MIIFFVWVMSHMWIHALCFRSPHVYNINNPKYNNKKKNNNVANTMCGRKAISLTYPDGTIITFYLGFRNCHY